MDDQYNHGWNSDCTVRWDETYFPSEVTQILVDTNADTDETIDKSDCDDIVTLVMMTTLTNDRFFLTSGELYCVDFDVYISCIS